jgi:hypothetical protein
MSWDQNAGQNYKIKIDNKWKSLLSKNKRLDEKYKWKALHYISVSVVLLVPYP